MLCTIIVIRDATRGMPLPLPYFLTPPQAGFPSPAQDYIETTLDLNDVIVRQVASTFFLTVRGDSMRDVGILDGGMLVVDRSITPKDGHIVVACYDGHLVVKRLFISKGEVMLVSENQDHPPIILSSEDDVTIWGVVTHSITSHL